MIGCTKNSRNALRKMVAGIIGVACLDGAEAGWCRRNKARRVRQTPFPRESPKIETAPSRVIPRLRPHHHRDEQGVPMRNTRALALTAIAATLLAACATTPSTGPMTFF